MSDYLWTICFGAVGFTLVVQHFRLNHLERWRDRVESTPSRKRGGWRDEDLD